MTYSAAAVRNYHNLLDNLFCECRMPYRGDGTGLECKQKLDSCILLHDQGKKTENNTTQPSRRVRAQVTC